MFVRRRKNRSGTTTVVVVDKSRRKFREVVKIGTGRTEQEVEDLCHQGEQYIKAALGLIPIDFEVSDAEREAAIAECGKGCEITRFKGLGELNAKEFKDFIGPDMRLTPVTCTDDTDVEKTIKFYMGANTPERKDYIMESLVCDPGDF